eukprot:2982337-Pyramimonas_sp.AAC.1
MRTQRKAPLLPRMFPIVPPPHGSTPPRGRSPANDLALKRRRRCETSDSGPTFFGETFEGIADHPMIAC